MDQLADAIGSRASPDVMMMLHVLDRCRSVSMRRRVASLAVVVVACHAAAGRAEAPVETPLVQKTLAECIAIALEHHPTLKAATATIEAANQQIWVAASPYLPQVNANYQVRRQQLSPQSATSGGVSSNLGVKINTFNSTGLTFSQLLFDFGQTLASIRSAQASERSAEDNRTNTRDTVILNVQQSYFNVLATRRLLGVADETVRQTSKQLEQAQGRHDVGVAPKFDVTTAEVNLANAQLNQVSARNNVAVARETLRNALGINGPLDFDVVDTLGSERMHMSEDEALSIAYDHRPDLLSQREQEAAQQEQITSLERQYLPTVNSFGQYIWSGTDFPLQDTWNIGASVNLSILSGGYTRAQIGQAKANLDVLKFNEEALRQNIALQVRQAVLNVQQAVESIVVAEKGQQEARENLAIAEGRYTTGIGNIIELTIAQASLTSAEATYVQALYSYQTSVAQLENAIGKPVVLENP
jgi:outer membrane protein